MEELKENKITVFLLCLSPFFVLISDNGSFTVRSIFLLILLAVLARIGKKNKVIRLNKPQKILFILMLEILLSTAINAVRHSSVVTIETLLDYMYFLAIFAWFYCSTSGYISKKSISKILKCYNIASIVMSLQIISMSLSGVQGKIMITNFLHVLMDENYVTALISVTPVYVFVSLLNDKKKIKFKILDVLVIMICSLAVALAGSRAALIGLIIGLCVTLFEYLKGRVAVKKLIFIFLIILLGLIFIVNIKNIMPTWIYNRYFNSNYMDNSNTTRLLIWKNALSGIKNQPILGFGMGIFSNLTEYHYTAGKSSPAHQTILDFGLYGGIIGIVLFISFIISVVIPIMRNKNTKQYTGVIACLAFISMILSATRSMFLWNNLIYLYLIFNAFKNENLEGE